MDSLVPHVLLAQSAAGARPSATLLVVVAAIVLIVAMNMLRHLMQPIRGVLRAMVSAGLVVLLMVLALGLILSSLVMAH